MSKHDYEVALELMFKQGISFRSLVMAAMGKSDRDEYKRLREKFPDIAHEYWDRREGVRGFLRGEDVQADIEYARRDVNTAPLPLHSRSKRYK